MVIKWLYISKNFDVEEKKTNKYKILALFLVLSKMHVMLALALVQSTSVFL